jgi:hypothetical protein
VADGHNSRAKYLQQVVKQEKESEMKRFVLIAASVAPLASTPAAAGPTTLEFPLTVSKGASKCLPHASGTVIDHSFGDTENLEVLVQNLPPNTVFDFFIIQVPNAPFGAAWYMGDITTGEGGTGVGNFVGRFSSETFIISQGATPAPNEFPSPPAVVPEATGGVKTSPGL